VVCIIFFFSLRSSCALLPSPSSLAQAFSANESLPEASRKDSDGTPVLQRIGDALASPRSSPLFKRSGTTPRQVETFPGVKMVVVNEPADPPTELSVSPRSSQTSSSPGRKRRSLRQKDLKLDSKDVSDVSAQAPSQIDAEKVLARVEQYEDLDAMMFQAIGSLDRGNGPARNFENLNWDDLRQ
jgi:hypothetical protein